MRTGITGNQTRTHFLYRLTLEGCWHPAVDRLLNVVEPAPVRRLAEEIAPLGLFTVEGLHRKIPSQLRVGVQPLWPGPIAVDWDACAKRFRLAFPLQSAQITGIPT